MQDALAFPCPTCGFVYALAPDYLAQYGGQVTACTNCNGTFHIPTLPAPAAEGAPVEGDVPMAVLAYAAPTYGAAAITQAVWSDRNLVVCRKGVVLPYACVK